VGAGCCAQGRSLETVVNTSLLHDAVREISIVDISRHDLGMAARR
jgi:hypothetical protein